MAKWTEKVNNPMISDFQTPIPVCDLMASKLPKSAKTILEPTPGAGNIVAAVERVFGSNAEIIAPSNFFEMDRSYRYDAVIMNPPFSSKHAFGIPDGFQHEGMKLGYYMLYECMNMADVVIALMPWFVLTDSDKRLRMIQDYGLKSITHLPRKTFRYSRIQCCILELVHGYSASTQFDTFNF